MAGCTRTETPSGDWSQMASSLTTQPRARALASRASDAPPMLSRVVGKHCESGDIVVRHAYLPSDLAPGDLIAVAATGAYCRSISSNYNHVPRPATAAS